HHTLSLHLAPATGSRSPPRPAGPADIWPSPSWPRRGSPPRTQSSRAAIASGQGGERTSCSSLSLHAARGIRIERIDPALPERACGTEYVVTDVGRDLDAVENRKLLDGLDPAGARVIDHQRERRLLHDVARHHVRPVAAVLLAQHDAVGLQQPRAALDRLDLDALDVELDQEFAGSRNFAVIDQIVECD